MTLPLHADLRRGIRRWFGLGNFNYGDCVEAAVMHIFMLKAVSTASTWRKLLYRTGFVVPTTAYTVGLYAEWLATQGQTLKQDPGTVPGPFLEWLKTEKRLIIDWGNVNYQASTGGEDRLHSALVNYVGLLVTMALTREAYDKGVVRSVWHIGPDALNQPDQSLQHAVAEVGYGKKFDLFVSWARVKRATRAYSAACINGAYVILTEQDKSNPNFAQLLANIKNL